MGEVSAVVDVLLMGLLVLVADTETSEGFEVVGDGGYLDELDNAWVEELDVFEVETCDEELSVVELLNPMPVPDFEIDADELDADVDPTTDGVEDNDPEIGSPRARIELSSAEYTVPLPN